MDYVKGETRGTSGSRFACFALESFDDLPDNIEDRYRFPPGLIFDMARAGAVQDEFRKISDQIPRRKLQELTTASMNGQAMEAPGELKVLDAIVQDLGGAPAGYIHLSELWDYLGDN